MRNIFAKYREIILGLLILILLAVSWLLYARTLKNDFQNEIISSLEEVSTQGENILEKEINCETGTADGGFTPRQLLSGGGL